VIDQSESHLLTSELQEAVSARVACLGLLLPLRPMLESKGIEFLQEEVKGLDLEKKAVFHKGGEVAFDRLVLAIGSVPNFQGDGKEEIPGARETYPFRDFQHACRLRMRVQECFAEAAKESDKEVRRSILTFVVAGGGSTGVEVAGELKHRLRWLAREAGLDEKEPRSILLEAAEHLVPEFNRGKARRAQEALAKSGVEVKLEARVVAYDGKVARLESGEEVFAPTLIWAAGVRGNRLLGGAGLRTDADGRVLVNRLMQVEGVGDVYVIGDSASVTARRGRIIRPSAQAALQEAEVAAWNIAAEFAGQEKKECFPRRSAFLVSCGGSEAVGWVGPLPVSGSLAWLLKEATLARYLRSLGSFSLFRNMFKQKLEGYCHKHE
jgi:NADH dehydrogenase